ncbi:hypothetical protein QYE76_067329 [Lolium multiflorum]|uniref:Aminotransferase-like plant mobile domain-containing protein n=1 Tax=Lolium multiflorum TaxID=4521 RepID=A0AAD8SD35_LOLMU|nr:hypothetical protein QYE76_067329 [Lolium multiflorum]
MAESFNANTEVSGLKVSDILLPHPSLSNSLCLGPRSTESPANLISCEANRIPFVNQNLDLSTWADCLRAWPNPPEDWVSWYNRMAKTHQSTWETTGIADALALSLSPLEKHENLLKTIGYFWSDALNCFMFGHGPMTPTLLDVAMITGQDIASPSPSAFRLPKNHIPNFPRLATRTFPDATGKQIRCTSYGQALYSLPGSKLIAQEASAWFSVFFQGLDNPLFFPYTESEHFENPVLFRLDNFADDTSTRQLYSVMIRPCFLPVGMSTSNRIIKPGYESYQPVVAARQLGLGQTDDTSSGEVKEVMIPSTTLDLATSNSGAEKAATLATHSAKAREPIASSPAAPMVLGEGYDLSNLLTFDPESIEPTAKASEASGPNATQGQFQQLKALLSSPIETLVEDTEGIKNILEDLQPHLPVTLQVKLWPVVTLSYRSRVTLAPLDTKTDTSTSTAELEILRKELEDLEERVRVTKQLIQDKAALIARSHEEAEGLKAELKADLAEIRALNNQLVTGQDEDDEAEIAEVDRVRASALCALEAFL